MKLTVRQLRQFVIKEMKLGLDEEAPRPNAPQPNMARQQQIGPDATAVNDALVTWHGLVEKGLFALPDKLAKALRNVKDPNQKRALQGALQKVQDAVHTLQAVPDDLKAVRGNR